MIELHNIDCMEYMATIEDKHFDLAIVDPPYGIGENGQRNVTGDRPTPKWKNPKSRHYVTFDDSEIPNAEYWQELFRVSKNQIVFGGNYFTEYLPPSKGWIVWDKQADIKEHLSMCELAWSSFDRKCNAKQGDKILDTHLGSGSIAIACHDYKFDLVGCELDKEYFDQAIKRLNNHQKQTKLF